MRLRNDWDYAIGIATIVMFLEAASMVYGFKKGQESVDLSKMEMRYDDTESYMPIVVVYNKEQVGQVWYGQKTFGFRIQFGNCYALSKIIISGAEFNPRKVIPGEAMMLHPGLTELIIPLDKAEVLVKRTRTWSVDGNELKHTIYMTKEEVQDLLNLYNNLPHEEEEKTDVQI